MKKEIRIIFTAIIILFLIFLGYPLFQLLIKSFGSFDQITTAHYRNIISQKDFWMTLRNSFFVSGASGLVTTVLAFCLSYTIHYTNTAGMIKKGIKGMALLPMLLPTITYGFAIIYSFGKQGLLTKIFGKQLFEIYGFHGLLIGYVIYTLPISFMLISNTMCYIDKKYMIVSRVMGDNKLHTFWVTIIRPLLGTLAASFIQSFFLSFTDFGIPASVGGQYEVIASVLYNNMLGSVPDFNNGSVVALIMLLPSVISIMVLRYLEKYNVRYQVITEIEIKKNRLRDGICSFLSLMIALGVLSVFLVIFLVPFITEWPYELSFTFINIKSVFLDSSLSGVYINSLWVAFLTALAGTLCVYGAALVTARSTIKKEGKKLLEAIALVTNTVPGMVLGVAFMFAFSGTSLQNTFLLMVLCNVVHFFSTPYLMMKGALEKINASWETTAMLMGDNWIKTIVRIVTPNIIGTIVEVFGYYFINGMVTISAIIFLAGARTMVLTTKIKELQHYAKFKEIFVLSLLILLTNLIAKYIFWQFKNIKKRGK